jgi:predicted nucleic acid-binding protein
LSAADLDAALGTADRVLLDSSTLIAFHSPAEQAHALAEHVLFRIESEADVLHGYVSVVSASEILVRPLRTGRQEFTFMHGFLTGFPNLTLLPMDLLVALQTANIRASSGLRLPDAIVIASGLLAGCEAIVTNDAGWRRRLEPLFREFRWIYLADYL